MIKKEVDNKQNLEKYQAYGHKAEKQMAFYLKRAFQNETDVFVLNDIRYKMNDDVAQIDHLIIHRYGFILVESKSVTSKISINEHCEWVRHYPKFTRGMPSPINQARRQADFLQNYLMARSDYLLRKKLLLKSSFTDFKYDVLVAISDNGIINRAENTDISGVFKADQITDEINKIISSYAETAKSILTLSTNYQFHDNTMDKITKYLVMTHKPSSKNAKTIEPKPYKTPSKSKVAKVEEPKVIYESEPKVKANSTTIAQNVCSKCKSSDLEVVYGKFGYYFKCNSCSCNTSIKPKCKTSSCHPKIRKKKLQFYKDCPECNTSELFYENVKK